MKGVFLSGFYPPSIRAVRGASIRTKFWQNYFLGKGFAKTSAHLFLNSDVANGKGEIRYEKNQSFLWISVDSFVLHHHPDNINHLSTETD